MTGKFLSKAILFSLVIGANAFSGGVSAANVYELAPVVVTATKTAESLEKVPASVSVVTAKDIEDHNCIRILSPHLRWGTRWSRSFA